MRTQRFRRLEEILGAPVDDQITEEHLQRLLDGTIAETDDLDFKMALYEKTDKGRAEVAKDVAAFANHIGGVIIIGIADVKGHASKLTPVGGADDAEIRRLRSLVADRVHPLPNFDILRCGSDQPQLGYLLILVPRSLQAPHAVSDPSDTALRYWARYGSQTLPMGESSVADRYRNRFELARSRIQRVEDLMSEGLVRLDRQRMPWVAVGVVPEAPGVMPLDSGGRGRLREWVRALPGLRLGAFPYLDSDMITIGPRRVYLGDTPGEGDHLVLGISGELHTDGSTFAASALWQEDKWGASEPYRLFDIAIVDSVAAALRLAARHAVDNAGASGEALVEARIIEPRRGDDPPSHSLVLYWERLFGGGFLKADPVSGARPLFTVPASRHTVDLSAVADAPVEWMIATRLVANDLLQAFGLAETPQIAPNGGLRQRYLGRGGAQITDWAAQSGLAVDSTALET